MPFCIKITDQKTQGPWHLFVKKWLDSCCFAWPKESRFIASCSFECNSGRNSVKMVITASSKIRSDSEHVTESRQGFTVTTADVDEVGTVNEQVNLSIASVTSVGILEGEADCR